ncbi:hypothetical protein RclHR1_03600006 [Rhizophagus clarus]|nr:hypothetical protein RclHR1_03600006 [Rhizophagus clarus]
MKFISSSFYGDLRTALDKKFHLFEHEVMWIDPITPKLKGKRRMLIILRHGFQQTKEVTDATPPRTEDLCSSRR